MPNKAARLKAGRDQKAAWIALAGELSKSSVPEARALGRRMAENAASTPDHFIDQLHWFFRGELRKNR